MSKPTRVSKVTADWSEEQLWRRGFVPPDGAEPRHHTLLRFAHARAVLEVILENLRGQRGRHTLALRFDGADHFSATDDLGGREPGNFRRQHQANLQLCVRMEQFLRLEQQSGAADVLGGTRSPAIFSERAIAQREMEIETASSEWWNFLFSKKT